MVRPNGVHQLDDDDFFTDRDDDFFRNASTQNQHDEILSANKNSEPDLALMACGGQPLASFPIGQALREIRPVPLPQGTTETLCRFRFNPVIP